MAFHRSLVPSAYTLQSREKVADVCTALGEPFGLRKATRSPLPNPVSLERASLATLCDQEYVVCEKTDGVRYALVLGRYSRNKVPYSVMVDRSLNVYEVSVIAEESYFDGGGSVFDGELVWEKLCNQSQPDAGTTTTTLLSGMVNISTKEPASQAHSHLCYIVFDAYRVRGTLLVDENYVQRLQAVNECFGHSHDNHANYDNTASGNANWQTRAVHIAHTGKIVCTCPLMKPKPCMPFYMLDTALRNLHSLAHQSDGLLFTPVDSPVVRGTHATCFKYKSCHSIDFSLVVQNVRDDADGQSYWTAQLFYNDTESHALAPAGVPVYTCLVADLPECKNAPSLAERAACSTIGYRDGHAHFNISEHDKLLPLIRACSKRGIPRCEFVVECDCRINDGFMIDVATNQVVYLVDTYILHARADKDSPNAKQTIERTLVNIDELISVDELLDAAKTVYRRIATGHCVK